MNSTRKLDQGRWFSLVRLGFVVAAAGLLLGATGTANAQPNQEQMKSILQIRQHLNQVEQQLSKIQHEAMSGNAALQKKQNAFESLLMSTMRDKGYKPQEDMKRLNALREKLRSGGLKPKERSGLIAEFQQKSMRLRKAQAEAFADAKVKKAQQDLQDAVVAAMKKKDPNTSKLLKQMDEDKRKLDKLRSGE